MVTPNDSVATLKETIVVAMIAILKWMDRKGNFGFAQKLSNYIPLFPKAMVDYRLVLDGRLVVKDLIWVKTSPSSLDGISCEGVFVAFGHHGAPRPSHSMQEE